MSEPRDDVGRLLRLAGKRAPVSEERSRRVRGAVHETWRAGVRRRRIRLFVAVGSAIAAGLLVAALLLRGRATDAPPPVVTTVVGGLSGYVPGADAGWGTTIDVPASGGIALRMPSGHSLRIAAGTHVVLRRPDRVELSRGKVYLDSGAEGAAAPITIATPIADVVEIGTRFEAAADERSLRVRVRDGEVSVRTPGGSREIGVGEELSWSRGGAPEVGEVPTYGPDWDWVVATAPQPDFDGRPASELFDWVARERGWSVRYEDEATRSAAARAVLHGDLGSLGPDARLEAAALASGLHVRIGGGTLVVESGRLP